MRRTLLSIAACGAAALAACAEPATAPIVPELVGLGSVTSVTEPTTGPWARIVEGETGPGSLYALHIPKSWNGAAVYYAHGIRPPLDPITLGGVNLAGTPEPLGQDRFFEVRDALGEKGYAFAYSSFSENGLAIKDAAQRTHQLRGLLAAELGGQPKRSFLAGYSLGALVALNLGERFPDQYSGVLAACGMVGGTMRELQYIGDVRALFDFFYPGVLPGGPITPPETPLTVAEVQQRVVGAVLKNPLGMFAIASTAQTPLAFVPGNLADPTHPTFALAFQTMLGSLVTALYYQLIGIPDVLDRTHNHSPYGNVGVTYTLGAPVIPNPAGLAGLIAMADAGVARFEMAPDARTYFEKYYQPTGRLTIPVLTVHNVFDPLVPFFHEATFAGIVAAAGSSDMLVQKAVPNYAHCSFDKNLIVGSVTALDGWATGGTKPGS